MITRLCIVGVAVLSLCACGADDTSRPVSDLKAKLVQVYESSDQFTKDQAVCIVSELDGSVNLQQLLERMESSSDPAATSVPAPSPQENAAIAAAIQKCRALPTTTTAPTR